MKVMLPIEVPDRWEKGKCIYCPLKGRNQDGNWACEVSGIREIDIRRDNCPLETQENE